MLSRPTARTCHPEQQHGLSKALSAAVVDGLFHSLVASLRWYGDCRPCMCRQLCPGLRGHSPDTPPQIQASMGCYDRNVPHILMWFTTEVVEVGLWHVVVSSGPWGMPNRAFHVLQG
jgi:hypothetical protein